MNRLYPTYLKLTGKPCLVIGGGTIAVQKVRELIQCEAQVTVISPKASPEILNLIKRKGLTYRANNFQAGDTEGFYLVIAATDDSAINSVAAAECAKRRILCNVADSPEQSIFFASAVLCQGDLKIAISTNGKSPALAKRIRKELEQTFTKEYALFLRYLGLLRLTVKKDHPGSIEQRKDVLEKIVNSEALKMLKCGERKQALEEIRRYLKEGGAKS